MNKTISIVTRVLGIFFTLLLVPQFSFAQCSLTCNSNVQVSLDANCLAQVLPDDILEGSNTCVGPLSVEVFDPSGSLIPTNPFIDATYIGQTLDVRVIDGTTGNFCEGSIDVRDYIAPLISCTNLSLICSASTHPDDIGYATVMDNCDTNATLSYTDELNDADCDPASVAVITRTWTAVDASGNAAVPCVQIITLQRPTLGAIVFPDNRDDNESPALDCLSPDLSPTNTGYPQLNGFDLINGTTCYFYTERDSY